MGQRGHVWSCGGGHEAKGLLGMWWSPGERVSLQWGCGAGGNLGAEDVSVISMGAGTPWSIPVPQGWEIGPNARACSFPPLDEPPPVAAKTPISAPCLVNSPAPGPTMCRRGEDRSSSAQTPPMKLQQQQARHRARRSPSGQPRRHPLLRDPKPAVIPSLSTGP